MEKVFPSLGQYEQYFQRKGSAGFKTLRNIVLIASRLTPIKLFLFGSGAYAAVFKGILDGKKYAIRCFLTIDANTISRYKVVGAYLDTINSNWKVDFQFLDNELFINDTIYPILKMEWIEGKLLNEFITQNIQSNYVLEEIQKQLLEISKNLEKHEVGHGDLQFGNIMVTGTQNSFKIKLIDYDGMYVPELNGRKAIELGRSEFQHPKRNASYFNAKMDRFSFWVMLAGLEAIKYDKSLWQPVMQGGYNTLDNCLFTAKDFSNPNQSELFLKLQKINNTNLNFYIEKLKWICLNDINAIPALGFSSGIEEHEKDISIARTTNSVDSLTKNFKINCLNGRATVLSSSFEKIGETPLFLNKSSYAGKTIIVSNKSEIKQITLNNYQNIYDVEFLNSIPEIETDWKIDTNNNIESDYKNRSEKIRSEIDELERKKVERKQIEKEKDEALEIKIRQEREELEKLREKRESQALKNKLEKEKQNKKKEKQQQRNSILLIVTVIVIIGLIILYNEFTNNEEIPIVSETFESTNQLSIPTSTNSRDNNFEEIEGVMVRNTLSKLLFAEEQRNFNDIFSFFSSNMSRYWDMNNPSYSDLKKRYEYIWGFTSNSKNKIEKIEKVNTYTYDLYTEFSYYNLNNNENFVTNSIIRYVFDNNGKIIATYGIEQNIQKQETELVESATIKYGFINTTDVILRERPNINSSIIKIFKYSGEKIEILGAFLPENKQIAVLNRDLNYSYEYNQASLKKGKGVTIISENVGTNMISIDLDNNTSITLNIPTSYLDKINYKWYKVMTSNGDIGWVYGKFIKEGEVDNDSSSTFKEKNNFILNSKQAEPPNDLYYKYKTKFENPPFEIPLRSSASAGGLEIYKCPKNADVYVIDKTTDNYFKVYVNGNVGYVTKNYLVRKY
tara:strand:- start:1112 stop:3817 length:2706 start_codon:yes stop_codon:yes gene_type:complete